MWKNLLQFGKGRDRINVRNIIAAGRQVLDPPNGPVRVNEALSTADFFCTTNLLYPFPGAFSRPLAPIFWISIGCAAFLCDAELVAWRRFMFLANTDNLHHVLPRRPLHPRPNRYLPLSRIPVRRALIPLPIQTPHVL